MSAATPLSHAGCCVFIVFLMNEDVLFVWIDVTLPGNDDDVCKSNDVNDKGKCTYDSHCCRVCICAAAFNDAVEGAIGIKGREGCPFARGCTVAEGYLEEREYLCEHTPDCEGMCAVLDPATLVPADCCDGRCEKKCDTAEP